MPRLHRLVQDEYVKYGLDEFDLEARQNTAANSEEFGSLSKKQKTGHGDNRSAAGSEAHRPLSMGLTTGDTPAGFGRGSCSEDEESVVLVLQTPKE